MGKTTEISWTDHSFNPWWGCQRVSPGCEHCYAETFSKRVGLKLWGPSEGRRFFGAKHWAEPVKWNDAARLAGVRRRVFCASMADVFEDRADLVAERARLFRLIELTTHLDWQLLTKRPQNMVKMAPESWANGWPRNVWAGTTAEDQQRLGERLEWILTVPAAIHFLSCEPLIGPLDLASVEPYYLKRDKHPHDPIVRINALTGHVSGPDEYMESHVDWVIVGGESGPGARPLNMTWALSVVVQCRTAGVPCFVKQLGAKPVDSFGDLIKLRHKKGGDIEEFPESLRVRQFPTVEAR